MNRRHSTLYERLLANSSKPDDQNENGCWVWTGRTSGTRWPYGRLNLRIDGKHTTVAAHRTVENLFRPQGELGADETIDHLCTNPLCINPDHWEVVSRPENSRRSQRRNPRTPTRKQP